jgi:hypothetical protein
VLINKILDLSRGIFESEQPLSPPQRNSWRLALRVSFPKNLLQNSSEMMI